MKEFYDEHTYLASNPDVQAAIKRGLIRDGYTHFKRYGRTEMKQGLRLSLMDRTALAQCYIRGAGIEIGALHCPLPLPPAAKVRYVDRFPAAELRRHYPELAELPLVEVDIIDDGEILASLSSASQDFVIANHFLEHCEDPLRTLGNLLRVLCRGGVLYMAIPDKRFTFDVDRQLTSLQHLERDHREGPAAGRLQHYREWVEFVDPKFGRAVSDLAGAEARAQALMAESYAIHYHVWDLDSIRTLLSYCRDQIFLPFSVEYLAAGNGEAIAVLRKTRPPSYVGRAWRRLRWRRIAKRLKT